MTLTSASIYIQIFNDYVEIDSSKDNGKGVYASIENFKIGDYEVIGLIEGHKLVDFRTDYTKDSGEFEISTVKIVDASGNDVSGNYVFQSDYIYIDIVD